MAAESLDRKIEKMLYESFSKFDIFEDW
jgi:hypothetical protein